MVKSALPLTKSREKTGVRHLMGLTKKQGPGVTGLHQLNCTVATNVTVILVLIRTPKVLVIEAFTYLRQAAKVQGLVYNPDQVPKVKTWTPGEYQPATLLRLTVKI